MREWFDDTKLAVIAIIIIGSILILTQSNRYDLVPPSGDTTAIYRIDRKTGDVTVIFPNGRAVPAKE